MSISLGEKVRVVRVPEGSGVEHTIGREGYVDAWDPSWPHPYMVNGYWFSEEELEIIND